MILANLKMRTPLSSLVTLPVLLSHFLAAIATSLALFWKFPLYLPWVWVLAVALAVATVLPFASRWGPVSSAIVEVWNSSVPVALGFEPRLSVQIPFAAKAASSLRICPCFVLRNLGKINFSLSTWLLDWPPSDVSLILGILSSSSAEGTGSVSFQESPWASHFSSFCWSAPVKNWAHLAASASPLPHHCCYSDRCRKMNTQEDWASASC